MSIFSRFFGKKDPDDLPVGELIANPDVKDPIGLQVLFAEACPRDAARLTAAFRSYHSSMAGARCDIDAELSSEGKLFGLVGWGKHVVRMVGFDLPMPGEAVEACVAPAHYPQDVKEKARGHAAHVLLYYAGYEKSPFEQYVALAAVAGVLARFGAIVVVNEAARTSFPAAALAGSDDGDIMELLQTLPLLILYCGFVKYNVEDVPGVWMRTYGAPLLGFPDLAVHAKGHHEGQIYFDMFENIYGYLRESESQLAPGHTMEIGGDEFIRLRLPGEEEEFLTSEDELLVVEVVGAGDIRR